MTEETGVSEAKIISDAEIIRVHGHANFGSMTPRQVVNDGIRKIAVGYHCGHTQFSILREHGLITKPRGMSYDCNLTKKGKRYFRALSAAPPPAPTGEAGRTITGVSLNGRQGEPAGMMTVTAHMSDGTEVVLIEDNGNVISHWKNTADLAAPPAPSADSGGEEAGRRLYEEAYLDGYQDGVDPECQRDPSEVRAEAQGDCIRDGWANNRDHFLKALAHPGDESPVERFRHKVRGTEYDLVGVGRAQGSMSDDDPVVIYRGDDGGLWARHQAEFSDGRFERVAAPANAVGSREAAEPKSPAKAPERKGG